MDCLDASKLTVINAPKSLLQSLQVQFPLPSRIQSGPETLDSGVAFILRLPKPSLHVSDEFGGAHDDGIGHTNGQRRAARDCDRKLNEAVARACWN